MVMAVGEKRKALVFSSCLIAGQNEAAAAATLARARPG